MHIWSNRTVYAICVFLKRQRHNFNLQESTITKPIEKRHWGLETGQIRVSHVSYVTDRQFLSWLKTLIALSSTPSQ